MDAAIASSIDRISRALSFIPAEDRDTWLRMGMAVKSGLSETGFDIWDAWSRRAASYNARDARDVWNSIRADGKVTLASLFHEAKKNGWCDDGSYAQPTVAELAERSCIAKIRAEQEDAELIYERANAAAWATAIWTAAAGAESDHPYLLRKQVLAVATLREIEADAATAVLGYVPKSRGEALVGRLLVVPVKVGMQLSTLELIDTAGRKTALAGRGTKAGGYWAAQRLPDGKGDGMTLLIGEGVATVLSAKQATGEMAVAALSSVNLPTVTKAMRERYPAATLVLLADLVNATGEPDAHAIEAAEDNGGKVAIPDFGAVRPSGATDFNDLFQLAGTKAVQRCIESAKVPARQVSIADWPEPVPLPMSLPPVRAFAPELLPLSLRAWVMDIAHRMQCPPDFPAVGALVALSSLIGARVVVQPKARDTWQVVPNLWGLVIGRPGVMKSPALSESLKPLHQIQAHEYECWEAEHGAWSIEAKLAEMRNAHNQKEANALVSKDPEKARALLRTEEFPEPLPRRRIVNDITVEKLGELLKVNPWGLLCYRDEIYGLLTSMDKPGQEGSRAFYLQAYDGDKGYTFDRIGRGEVHNSRVCLAMLGGIQPGRLQEYVRGAVSGGGSDDGLLQRFGLAVWPDVNSEFFHIDQAPDAAAKQAAWAVFEQLAELQPVSDIEPQVWRFNPAAQVAYIEWLVPFEAELRKEDLHPALISHLAKYRKLIPALALLFALVDTPENDGVIGEAEMIRAIAWAEYLRTHANRMYSAAVTPETAGASILLKKIHAGALGVEFTSRAVVQKNWAGLNSPDTVRKAADVLVEYGWLRREMQKTGGRPSERYVVNPAVLKQEAA